MGIALVVFAIIRIITAIFLKETLAIASKDAEMMVDEHLKEKQAYIKKLENVFKAVDVSGKGTLNLEEFETVVSNTSVKTWLQVLELEVHDAHSLFHILDDGDGEVTYEEFLQGVMRVKGQARSMDVVALMRSSDKSLAATKELYEKVNGVQGRIDRMRAQVDDVRKLVHRMENPDHHFPVPNETHSGVHPVIGKPEPGKYLPGIHPGIGTTCAYYLEA